MTNKTKSWHHGNREVLRSKPVSPGSPVKSRDRIRRTLEPWRGIMVGPGLGEPRWQVDPTALFFLRFHDSTE